MNEELTRGFESDQLRIRHITAMLEKEGFYKLHREALDRLAFLIGAINQDTTEGGLHGA
jgi:hypothetical protein